jgi:hypothetical protein
VGKWETTVLITDLCNGNPTNTNYKYYEGQGRVKGNPMIDEDKIAVSGRKKRYGLRPYYGQLVIEFLSERGGVWKESQIMSNLREKLGSHGLDRGKITFFCRCAKDSNGDNIFAVTGNRPRNIQYRPIETR